MSNVKVTIRTQIYLNQNPVFLLLPGASLKFRRQNKTENIDLGVIQLSAVVEAVRIKRVHAGEPV